MTDKILSKVGYMAVGLGVGSLISILFTPQSGEDTREYLTDKAKGASGYAQKQARDCRGRAGDLIKHAKEVVSQKKEQIVTAVNVGREVYHQEQLVGRSGTRNSLASRPGF
ncbi:MAG: YtxH domain-containing protein [Candidatus Acidiferrales bacterium]|jgi:gas vesicle protein